MEAAVVLEHFEQALGARLPEDYRNFLLTDPDYEPGWLDQLYPLCDDWNLERYYQINRKNDRVPTNMLAIGDDGMGNEVWLSLRAEDPGHVYFFNHEGGALTLLATTFTGLLPVLQGPEPE